MNGPGNGWYASDVLRERQSHALARRSDLAQKMLVKVWDENCKLRCKLALDPADIEEAVARCGWMILNDAQNVTAAHRAEISRLEAQGFAAMETRNESGALAWWNLRKV